METVGAGRMADGPAKPVQVHSLLHINLTSPVVKPVIGGLLM
jgi:hypothetical protein